MLSRAKLASSVTRRLALSSRLSLASRCRTVTTGPNVFEVDEKGAAFGKEKKPAAVVDKKKRVIICGDSNKTAGRLQIYGLSAIAAVSLPALPIAAYQLWDSMLKAITVSGPLAKMINDAAAMGFSLGTIGFLTGVNYFILRDLPCDFRKEENVCLAIATGAGWLWVAAFATAGTVFTVCILEHERQELVNHWRQYQKSRRAVDA